MRPFFGGHPVGRSGERARMWDAQTLSLLGRRFVLDRYERRCRYFAASRRHLTRCSSCRRRRSRRGCCCCCCCCCCFAVGGRGFAGGSRNGSCARHGNDGRERRPALVGKLRRSRARLLECVDDTDLTET